MITQFLIAKPGAAAQATVAAPTPALLESVKRQIQANITITKRLEGAVAAYKVSFVDFTGKTKQTPEFKDRMTSTSPVVVYKNGVSFTGTAIHSFPASLYTSLGLQSDVLVKTLDFISKNEGNYDAINSYDKAIFSFGFVQFAGGNRTLQSLLALIKYRDPEVFYDAFQRFGIDVEYSLTATNRFAPAPQTQIVVINPEIPGGIAKGQAAETFINRSMELTGVFIRAGHDPEVAKYQVMLAITEFFYPAIKQNFTLSIGTLPITSVAFSPAVLAAYLDTSINKGVSGAVKIFTAALQTVISRQGLSAGNIKSIDEKGILDAVMALNPTDANLQKRIPLSFSAGFQKLSV